MRHKWSDFKVGDRVYNETSGYGIVTHMDYAADDFCVKYDNDPFEVEEDIIYVTKVTNLIWEYYQTDGYTYQTTHAIPFEYTSKEDFCFHVLSKIDELKKKDKDALWIPLLGIEAVQISELEYIEHQVITLEEWIAKNKPKNIF
jgi:hypothetical protein